MSAIKRRQGERLYDHPDPLIPTQYFARLRVTMADAHPEFDLMCAILDDAHTVLSSRWSYGDHRVLIEETVAWVERIDYAYLYGLDSICEHLGFDPEYVRHGLLAVAREHGHLREEHHGHRR